MDRSFGESPAIADTEPGSAPLLGVTVGLTAGEMTVAQDTRRDRGSAPSIGTCKRQFIENARAGLVAKNSRIPAAGQLEAESRKPSPSP